MKRVVNLINFEPVICDVDDSWLQCSVTGEFRPPSEFSSDGINQTRINCTRAYTMPMSEMVLSKKLKKTVMESAKYLSMSMQLSVARSLNENSILATDMIEILRGLIEFHGDNVRVCMTQEGYYAEGRFADIGEIHCLGADYLGNDVVSIGHSAQNG